MSSSARPAALLVHGAWHVPAHYAGLEAMLSNAGYTVAIPRLPTCSKTLPIAATFADDCEVIRSKATELADNGHDFIVLMHSYGGVVGTNSLKGLSSSDRSKRGLHGGACRLIYMCAFLLPLNACLATAFGGELPPLMEEQAEQGTCTMKDPERIFYDEVPDKAERERLLGMLTWHPTSAQKSGGSLRYAAYRDIPTTYLICENDLGLVPEAQRGMIQAAGGDVVKHGEGEGALETGGVFGGQADVFACQGGHSPFLSCPEEILKCVDQETAKWAETSK